MTMLTDLKGVGEKTAALFMKLHIQTAEDLLHYYPVAYDICEPCENIQEADEGKTAAVFGTLCREPELKRVRNFTVVTSYIRDSLNGVMKVTWFNMPYLKKTLHVGMEFVFRGKIVRKHAEYVMEQPVMYKKEEYEKKISTMQPIYPLTKGVTNNMVRKAVAQAFLLALPEKEYLPDSVRDEYALMNLEEAEQKMHFPIDKEDFIAARRRIVFGEFFSFLTFIRKIHDKKVKIKNHFSFPKEELEERLLKSLPYSLTGAQEKVRKEIVSDMQGEGTMNRLVQGDVGSGKTIVALLAMVLAAENGYQAALMAPTEVLATQHYHNILSMFEEYQIPCSLLLLTGSMTAKQKREAYEKIKEGSVSLVVGTHAVIQEKVEFYNLALVVTDEQHRFGVRQREELASKGVMPHTLVMSATPIPRTLAIMMYGDLDISIIDELPANRLPIKNCVVDTGYRKNAYRFIEKEIKSGRQAYVICSMVEESEGMEAENVVDYTKMLRKELSDDIRIEYLHGKMKPAMKNQIMEEFAANRIQVLVSTTVIEVGVNVPNATVMMVENAERFGLAGLHQLRGRVGRGKYQSYCIFVSGTKKKDSMDRLQILAKSNDGFYIASEDLKTRGPGDIFGIRQSGELGFLVADIFTDAAILKDAGEAVEAYLEKRILYQPGEEERLESYLRESLTFNMITI